MLDIVRLIADDEAGAEVRALVTGVHRGTAPKKPPAGPYLLLAAPDTWRAVDPDMSRGYWQINRVAAAIRDVVEARGGSVAERYLRLTDHIAIDVVIAQPAEEDS